SAVAGSASVNNLGGRVGAYLSDSLVQVFGTGSFFFPMITLILGWALIRGKKFPHWPWILFSGILFLTSLCAFVAVLVPSDPFFGSAVKAGGLAGSALGDFLVQWMNTGGAALVLGTLLFLSLLAMAQISVNDLIENTGKAVHTGIALTG
ncbi:MAG: DNA translocase FtsK, partial [Nitrospinaceae bacterium]|nr:DNA translocase FtsK [Nitrospinaceae bacterium]NIU95337.1 DNA translocase FtsK [Nitrospinaceae bacterium]